MIIVTLSTLPQRLLDPNEMFGARPGLKTILEQTNVEYEVHLHVPYSYNDSPITIPEWLIEWQKKYKHLKVFRCKDLGPITKIYYTLKRVTDPSAILITVDDDLIYDDGFVKSHIEARQRYPDCAIGYAGIVQIDETSPADHRGVHATGPHHFITSRNQDYRVRLLEGYKTVSYLRSFFDNDFDTFATKHWNDDIILSAYMGYKNIKKIILKCENCNEDYTPRVETYPIIKHAPITSDLHGCNIFRRDISHSEKFKDDEALWYKLGYLER